MNAVTAVVEPGNVTFSMPASGGSTFRELSDFELESVSGGFVCGGLCIGGAIAGAIALVGGGVYIGWKAAHNTAEAP